MMNPENVYTSKGDEILHDGNKCILLDKSGEGYLV
jgi:hypothetical protein